MRPGDIFLLEQSAAFNNVIEPAFLAVLACPLCGALFLLTSPQYFGVTAVICQSRFCSCRFRIDNQSRLIYLPVN